MLSLTRGLVALGVALLLGACGGSPNFGDAFAGPDDLRLPDREGDRAEDPATPPSPAATRPAPTSPSPPPPPRVEPMDAGTDAPPARSAFCGASELVICFEFENVVKDGSVSALDPTTVSGVSFVAGKAGLAVQVGSQSAIRFGYSPMWNASAATIEAWVSLSPNGSSGGVIFDADDRFAMQIEDDGDLKCITADGDETGGTVVKGQFTHVACTFESNGKIRNYVGGIERDNGSGGLGTSNVGGAAIGGNAPSGDPFVGAIDSLRVFRSVRTPAEIAQAAQ